MSEQTWTAIEGTIYGNEQLSSQSRHQASLVSRLLEVAEPATEFAIGKKSGDKVGFRLVARISGTSETPIAETSKIPFKRPSIYHGTGQVYRYGAAIPWTGERQDLDRLNVEEDNIVSLRDHFTRTVNKIIHDKLVANRSFTYVATSAAGTQFNTAGTFGHTAAANYSLFHARKLKLKAKQYNIPPADGNDYWFFISPTLEDNIFNDVGSNGFVDVSKYAPSGAEGALVGEIGKFAGMRHVVDNDVIDDSVGSGSAYGSGFVCGEEALKEIMVYPIHFRANMNVGDDFGNLQALAWQGLFGYCTPWNYTTHGQGSIIHYGSQ